MRRRILERKTRSRRHWNVNRRRVGRHGPTRPVRRRSGRLQVRRSVATIDGISQRAENPSELFRKPDTDDAYSAEAFRRDGYAVVDLLADYLAATEGRPGKVLAYRPPDEMLDRWPAMFPETERKSLVELLPHLLEDSHHLHHPGYVGHQVSAPLPVSALAELVASLLNNGMAEYEMGPAANAMEKRLIDWFGDLLGFPLTTGGALTSGGSVGNLTALAAARQATAGLDLWKAGLADAPRLSILVSDQAHYSIDRAARILGLGAAGVQHAATDTDFRLDPEALDEARRRAEGAGRRV